MEDILGIADLDSNNTIDVNVRAFLSFFFFFFFIVSIVDWTPWFGRTSLYWSAWSLEVPRKKKLIVYANRMIYTVEYTFTYLSNSWQKN